MLKMFLCDFCSKSFRLKVNLKHHINEKHIRKQKVDEGNAMQGTFDIRLKENFKLFISGPSRCGKTVFVSKLIENIHTFAKKTS